jgi:hypothetical protein
MVKMMSVKSLRTLESARSPKAVVVAVGGSWRPSARAPPIDPKGSAASPDLERLREGGAVGRGMEEKEELRE